MKTVSSKTKIHGWGKWLVVEHHPSSGMHAYSDVYVYDVPDDVSVPAGCTVMSTAEVVENSR